MKHKNLTKFILILILLYGIFLRFYNLGGPSFWIDEGFSSYTSLQIINNNINFIGSQYSLFSGSQIISFFLFDVSDLSSRLPSILFSSLNIIIIYLISINLFKDKKQALFSAFLFSFLTWEIIWGRQARFYSLLQLIFSINIYLLIKIVKDLSIKHLNIGIIFLYIGALFHPFLWSSLLIFILGILFMLCINIKKIKSYKKKKLIISLVIILLIFGIELAKFLLTQQNITTPEMYKDLPQHFINSYIKQYSIHLNKWLGILPAMGTVGMFILIYKRKVFESIILTFSYIFIFYIISQKGYLFHTRYLLILYPIIIILSSYTFFFFYNKVKFNILKFIYSIIVCFLILYTASFTFFPKENYLIDKTSPQPNFKKAYSIIPSGEKVISGFPMLCEWYYSDKGECNFSLAINYFGDKRRNIELLGRGVDTLTNIKYLQTLDNLIKGEKYYFVIDNLSNYGLIKKHLITEVLSNGKILFDNGRGYNNIKILLYTKK